MTPSALRVRIGTDGDAVLQDRTDGVLTVEERTAGVQVGEIRDWTWALVKMARKDLGSLRVFELRPGLLEQAVKVGGLEVSGLLEVVRKVNERRAAEAAWRRSRSSG